MSEKKSKQLRKKQKVLIEYMKRLTVAYAAYMYEIKADSPMSDIEWDYLARKIDLNQSCGDKELDEWYQEHFTPDTAMWIHNHPQKEYFAKHYEQNGNSMTQITSKN